MIDPVHSLSFSIHSNPGVYALLLGSGVSKSANIPTGWEVTLDLIRKLAELSKEPCEPSPEQWYHQKYGKDPNYSDLLEKLARTPTERQQFLYQYFEPNEFEKESGEKSPTTGHQAIAQLVADGFIRIILTTNFDRLIETAIREAGVDPQILSTPDQIKGAKPLIHTNCCIIKVNGDYHDTRIRNTEQELNEYPDELNHLLDQVFDKFGLIVCGWSGDWDNALRNTMERSTSRRYSVYWAVKGTLTDKAQKLISDRDAIKIPIHSADDFFDTIRDHIIGLNEFSKQPPSSKDMTIQRLKLYLSDRIHRIKLVDLIDVTLKQIQERLSEDDFLSGKTFNQPGGLGLYRIKHYETVCETFTAMAMVASSWMEKDHYSIWDRVIRELGSVKLRSGDNSDDRKLYRFPATLLFYALGVGALKSNRLDYLKHLFDIIVYNFDSQFYNFNHHRRGARILPPYESYQSMISDLKYHEDYKNTPLPLHHKVFDALKSNCDTINMNEEQFTQIFHKFEVLIALNSLSDHESSMISGLYCLERDFIRTTLFSEIKISITTHGDESPYVTSNIFGSNVKDCMKRLDLLEQEAKELHLRYRYS